MLLLLMDIVKFQLRDQFEIWQGITTAQTKEKNPDEKISSEGYKLINLSGMNPCTGQINEKKLLDFYPVRDINPNKLLQRYDYLISCKGEVKGYSLLYSDTVFKEIDKENSSRGLLASNHFLILRPRMISEANSDELRFLHNILDIIIPSMRKLSTEKKGKAKYLNINDVASYTFNFPFNSPKEIENFKGIFDRYTRSLNKVNKAKREIEKYNISLEHKILINE